MNRLDRYCKKMAACLLTAAALMLTGAGGQTDSFAVPSSDPLKEQTQNLTSPGVIVVAEETQEAAETAQAPEQQAQMSDQAAQASAASDQAAQESAASGQTASSAAVTAAFGEVTTPVTDSSSLFGSGRLTMLANHDTEAQQLAVIIENGAGGLIVVDGGWRENADYVLNQIKQKGGHVAAWLLTHPDSDHVGVLAEILYNHSSEITIDGIYYSFLEDSWYREKDSSVADMVAYLKGAFARVSPQILHGDIVSGQVIEAGPARIQVLNQAYKTNSDFVNNSSVAYLVSLNGTNVVFLGDLARAGGEMLMNDHDLGALKCSIVQMAHHGQNGVTYEVYKALRPSICLWPTPQWLWDNDSGAGPGSGSWLTQETKNWMVRLGVKTYYCTKDGDQVIE